MSDDIQWQYSVSGRVPTLAAALAEFKERFPTEIDCLEELYRRGSSEGVWRCHHCGHHDLHRERGARVAKCKDCKKTTWLTAGTFFDRIRLVRPWLTAIWLLDYGLMLSSSRFCRVAGIAQSSALHIFKKLSTVMQCQLSERAAPVSSGEFALLFCKRSRETPARQHPRAEQWEVEKHSAEHVCASEDGARDASAQSTLRELTCEELQIYNCLSDGPLHIDALCRLTGLSIVLVSASLTGLELRGLVLRQFGNFYARSGVQGGGKADNATAATAAVELAITEASEWIRGLCHGISRKYLQNYLSAVSYCRAPFLREKGLLLRACWEYGPLTYRQILAYVSPAVVRLFHCPGNNTVYSACCIFELSTRAT